MRDAQGAVEEIRSRSESEASGLIADAERRADEAARTRLEEIRAMRGEIVSRTEAIERDIEEMVGALALAAERLGREAGIVAPPPADRRATRVTVSERREISVTVEHDASPAPGPADVSGVARPLPERHDPAATPLTAPPQGADAAADEPPRPGLWRRIRARLPLLRRGL